MQSSIEIAAAIVTMTREMSIWHVFDDTLQDRGAGALRYVLATGAERYLARYDDDVDEMVVSPTTAVFSFANATALCPCEKSGS